MPSTAQLMKMGFGPMANLRFQIGLIVPTRPGDIARRHWNKLVKEALRVCLETHHKKRIPLHFRQDAHGKYGYKERTKAYRRYKERVFKSRRDLVKTGASEKRMKREKQIIIGGAAEGGKKPLVGRLRLNFDFTQTEGFKRSQQKRFVRSGGGWFDRGKQRGGVTIADMKREVQAFTPDERAEFAKQFWREVWRGYNAYNATRKRVRMPGAGGAAEFGAALRQSLGPLI